MSLHPIGFWAQHNFPLFHLLSCYQLHLRCYSKCGGIVLPTVISGIMREMQDRIIRHQNNCRDIQAWELDLGEESSEFTDGVYSLWTVCPVLYKFCFTCRLIYISHFTTPWRFHFKAAKYIVGLGHYTPKVTCPRRTDSQVICSVHAPSHAFYNLLKS